MYAQQVTKLQTAQSAQAFSDADCCCACAPREMWGRLYMFWIKVLDNVFFPLKGFMCVRGGVGYRDWPE
jgi:hypothetical protein